MDIWSNKEKLDPIKYGKPCWGSHVGKTKRAQLSYKIDELFFSLSIGFEIENFQLCPR